MLLIFLPFGLRRNPVWRDSSNVKRERAVGDGYGIEKERHPVGGMSLFIR